MCRSLFAFIVLSGVCVWGHPCDDVPGHLNQWVVGARRVGVAVVGGGVAGMAATRTLVEAGVDDVVLVEAKDRLGGRVHTVRQGGFLVETGAEFIHGAEGNPVYDIAKSLGQAANFSMDFDSIAATPSGRQMDVGLRLLVQGLVEASFTNESTPYFGQPADVMFKEWFEEYYPGDVNSIDGRAWLHTLEKLVRWANGMNDWTRIAVDNLPASEDQGEDHIWKDSYDSFLDYLKAGIPERHVMLEWPVCRVVWNLEGQVLLVARDGSSLLATNVIMALSPGHLQERHAHLFSPPLPAPLATALQGIELAVADKIQLAWDEPWWGEGQADINIVWDDKSLPQEQSWLYEVVELIQSSKGPGALLTAFVTGPGALLMEATPEDQVRDSLVSLLANVTGLEVPQPALFKRSRWGEDVWARGAYSSFVTVQGLQNGLTMDRTPLSQPLCHAGNMVVQWAGEYTSSGRVSTVDGAYSTGIREANRLLEAMREATPAGQEVIKVNQEVMAAERSKYYGYVVGNHYDVGSVNRLLAVLLRG